jgi:hypothetical protein
MADLDHAEMKIHGREVRNAIGQQFRELYRQLEASALPPGFSGLIQLLDGKLRSGSSFNATQ